MDEELASSLLPWLKGPTHRFIFALLEDLSCIRSSKQMPRLTEKPYLPVETGLKLESKPKIWTMNPGIEFEMILVIICIKTPVAAPEKQPISNPIKDPCI
jgi:hypothetical protein